MDYFKQYNDFYGHAAGDECLKQVARVLRSGRRETDLAARVGGEEFAMLLPNTDLVGAVTIAEVIRSSIERLHLGHSKSPMKIVTASIGVASIEPRPVGTVQDLMEAADQALYQAKRSGRNLVIGTPMLTAGEEQPS